MIVTIQTPRFILSTINEDHAEALQDFRWRNESFFKPWGPAYSDYFFQLEFIQDFLRKQAILTQHGIVLRLYIFHQSDKQLKNILGNITYSNIQRGVAQYCNLGYKIDERFNGQGIATESLNTGNQYAFETLKLHRIEANIMPHNKASIRVVEKLGFHKEGIAQKLLKINGQWQDHIRYALLNSNEEV
ncbi:MAG: GNAT family N-acetyltransferase [Aureispira sp.]|nr:GNAT family N-acetyltransferase [Aureispira sp.]